MIRSYTQKRCCVLFYVIWSLNLEIDLTLDALIIAVGLSKPNFTIIVYVCMEIFLILCQQLIEPIYTRVNDFKKSL